MSAVFHDERDLLVHARRLAGLSLVEVASSHGLAVPDRLVRNKGFVGELIETALGLPRSSAPRPDFEHLDIELKTLPVTALGRVLETTYVCRLDVDELAEGAWAGSRAQKKLARVLFVPVEGDRALAVGARRIGAPFLWSPDHEEEALLRADWEDAADLCARGLFEALSARRGHVLQVRPKAKNAAVRSRRLEAESGSLRTLPRGFYLRTAFTARILARAFAASTSVH